MKKIKTKGFKLVEIPPTLFYQANIYVEGHFVRFGGSLSHFTFVLFFSFILCYNHSPFSCNIRLALFRRLPCQRENTFIKCKHELNSTRTTYMKKKYFNFSVNFRYNLPKILPKKDDLFFPKSIIEFANFCH